MIKSFLKVAALSLLMLPTSVLLKAQNSPYSSYLFAFFSNNSPRGEQIRYAVSEDGKTFYMVLTDMRSSQGWQSNDGLILMKSTDLLHWEHTAIDFPTRFPNLEGFDRQNLHAVWAPQTIWDPVEKKYMIY